MGHRNINKCLPFVHVFTENDCGDASIYQQIDLKRHYNKYLIKLCCWLGQILFLEIYGVRLHLNS